MELTQALKNEYLSNWASCAIKPAWTSDLSSAVKEIKLNQTRYTKVAEETGVPWYVIAILHCLEASFDFKTHLHNGDRLTARTIQVPAGRPKQGKPPFTWEESAIDALNFEEATGILSWDLPTLFWFLEGYNGWGYRTGAGKATTPPSRSPYIYSGTTFYDKGKYGSDGEFDPSLVSAQLGCMALLFGLVGAGLVDLATSVSQVVEANPSKVGSIQAWQNILNGCGYFPTLYITGDMDEATVAMTKRFQKQLSLTEDGTVTPETWKAGVNHRKLAGWSEVTPPISPKKNPTLATPSGVGTVQEWQHILNGCGYRPLLALSGFMDGTTIAMTKKFQKDLGLSETGTVTPVTWEAGINHKKLPGWRPSLPSLITERLYSFYSNEDNYNDVYDNVMGWYGTTANGCIAFLSTALRLSGYDVPIESDSSGFNISLWTTALSDYLEKGKSWAKDSAQSKLLPGDIVFTQGNPITDVVPAHAYMFAGWSDKTAQVAWVIDNQGFTHERNISVGGGGFNFTPFDYFLRA